MSNQKLKWENSSNKTKLNKDEKNEQYKQPAYPSGGAARVEGRPLAAPPPSGSAGRSGALRELRELRELRG